MTRATIRATILISYIASVLAANIVTSTWGLIPAGFGLLVPSGTYLAGLALSLRDAVHEWAGLRWVWIAIATGTVLSVAMSDGRIALASGAAFAVSELLDLAVYSRLRRNGWRRALVVSNIVGALADTSLFLWLSGFGITAEALTGQILVKSIWVTATALGVAEIVRRALARHSPATSHA
ncbi:VUT family protein [Saccharothrix obliqua]|uniref:VUT family protein n=1 Tax=Saccharothrix obliqua TaxID=2861747 RepID=UPI001C5EE461|nr:VUT family protein [Saccharothrix obliqua]MBW4717524.1 VUT family protein [Saccharothrix obliqua]